MLPNTRNIATLLLEPESFTSDNLTIALAYCYTHYPQGNLELFNALKSNFDKVSTLLEENRNLCTDTLLPHLCAALARPIDYGIVSFEDLTDFDRYHELVRLHILNLQTMVHNIAEDPDPEVQKCFCAYIRSYSQAIEGFYLLSVFNPNTHTNPSISKTFPHTIYDRKAKLSLVNSLYLLEYKAIKQNITGNSTQRKQLEKIIQIEDTPQKYSCLSDFIHQYAMMDTYCIDKINAALALVSVDFEVIIDTTDSIDTLSDALRYLSGLCNILQSLKILSPHSPESSILNSEALENYKFYCSNILETIDKRIEKETKQASSPDRQYSHTELALEAIIEIKHFLKQSDKATIEEYNANIQLNQLISLLLQHQENIAFCPSKVLKEITSGLTYQDNQRKQHTLLQCFFTLCDTAMQSSTTP